MHAAGKIKIRAFITCIREDGLDRFADYVVRNAENGIVYQRSGITGDYDLKTEADVLRSPRTGSVLIKKRYLYGIISRWRKGRRQVPMYHDDWLMSQIKLLAAAIAKIIFRKDVIFYEVKDDENKNETDELFLYLRTLLTRAISIRRKTCCLNPCNPTIRIFCCSPLIFIKGSTT